MENEQSGGGSSWELSVITSLEQNDELKSLQEVMVRRMKNRERQRRYRARKRLEADRKKIDDLHPLQYPQEETANAITSMPLPEEINHVVSRRNKESTIIHFTPTQVDIPVNCVPVDFVTRVHSHRDWKRDARRAHMIKQQDGRDESQTQSFSSGTKNRPSDNGCQSGSPLDSNQERTVSRGRRHWKEEARNKKS